MNRSRFDNDQKTMLNYVVKNIEDSMNINKFTAIRMIFKSPFIKLLRKNPEFTAHQGVEFWGDEIILNNGGD